MLETRVVPGKIIKEGRVCTAWDRARKTRGNAGPSPSWQWGRGSEQADGAGMVSLGLGKHEPSLSSVGKAL